MQAQPPPTHAKHRTNESDVHFRWERGFVSISIEYLGSVWHHTDAGLFSPILEVN